MFSNRLCGSVCGCFCKAFSWMFENLFKVLSIIVIVFVLFGVLSANNSDDTPENGYIARLNIDGAINLDRNLEDRIRNLKSNKKVKAVILDINSPGGSYFGASGLYNALCELKNEKPVVTFISGLAASAGYMLALSSDYMVLNGLGFVGSIGVFLTLPEISKLLDTVGAKVNLVSSSPIKTAGIPFKELTEEERKELESVVERIASNFTSLVAERRGVSIDDATHLSTGEIFNHAEAIAHKLVDKIGTESDALQWLYDEKSVDKELKIITNKKNRGFKEILNGSLSSSLQHVVTSLINGFSFTGNL